MTVPRTPTTPEDFGHNMRFSDSSLYDEVCMLCGANDGRYTYLRLRQPCPNAGGVPHTGGFLSLG